jgi:hypothetical protein
MSNLIDTAKELEFLPDYILAEEINNPNSIYPKFMLLAEVQDRRKLRELYEKQANMQEQPTMTVADEAFADFQNQVAGQGAMLRESAVPLEAVSMDADLPSIAPPMAQMASGGLTGFQAGGSSALTSTFDDPYAEQDVGFFDDPGAAIRQRYTKEDGTFDFGKAAEEGLTATAIALALAPEPIFSKAAAVPVGIASRIVAGGRALFSKPARQAFMRGLGRFQDTLNRGRQARQSKKLMGGIPTGTKLQSRQQLTPPGYFERLGGEFLRRTALPLGARLGLLGAVAAANLGGDKEQDPPPPTPEPTPAPEPLPTLDRLENPYNDAMLLTQLGGAVGTAKNLGELAAGIAEIDRERAAVKTEVDQFNIATQLNEAKLQQLDLQVRKLVRDLENADVVELQTTLSALEAGFEAGTVDRDKFGSVYNDILVELLKRQNIPLAGLAGGAVID